jgi:hypothetical protein
MTWNEDHAKEHWKTTIARDIKIRDMKKKEKSREGKGTDRYTGRH